ncbi:MAG: [LysW]-lysine hydrolase [Planctomycetota bacterium]|nr:[LysW]-lysine hydrolase [Planctomycetota bacterium]
MSVDPVELLREMVAIESLSGAEAELAEYLVDRMSGLGFDAFVDGAGNAVGVRRGPEVPGAEPREVVLLGHMDTVPGNVPQRIAGGRLYGRGAVDAKGPLATFVMAVAGVEPAHGVKLVVIGAVEEESATSKGARFVAPLHRPEACIIGEPSGWDALTIGYKGRMLVDYRREQPSGHSAGPQGAVAEPAAAFWQAVKANCESFNADRPRLFDQLMPSLRSIRTRSDGLTDTVEVTLGFRLPPDFDAAAFKRAVQIFADDAPLVFYGEEPAWTSPRTTPLARAFQRAIRFRDGEPRFKHKTGTSDMNVLGPAWGCPIGAYGPGDSKLDHAPEEHLVLAEYERAIAVLSRVLVEAGYAT